MDAIKEAFSKIRRDMNLLFTEVSTLQQSIHANNSNIQKIEALEDKISNIEENIQGPRHSDTHSDTQESNNNDMQTDKQLINTQTRTLNTQRISVHPLENKNDKDNSVFLMKGKEETRGEYSKIVVPELYKRQPILSNNNIRGYFPFESPINIQTQNQTNQTQIPTIGQIPTDNTLNIDNKILGKIPLDTQKMDNYDFSIGNEGVPTDIPTDTQLDTQTDIEIQNRVNRREGDIQTDTQQATPKSEEIQNFRQAILTENKLVTPLIKDLGSIDNTLSEFERANKIFDSLDDIKKEIRAKFKQLTPQEMLIFSTLYTLENQGIQDIGYSILAQTLNLTESSIRDYVNKLIKKGIPLDKQRINNKTIVLKVDNNLKKVATLPTIRKLREI
ncbi:MAG: hypothetical protein ACI83O_000079 [Patescibacteria group bacterium]|jgi:hypothetical protein